MGAKFIIWLDRIWRSLMTDGSLTFLALLFQCDRQCCFPCFCAQNVHLFFFLHHGSPPMCPLLMASLVIEFDAAHLQPNKRAVCKNPPDSPIQRYWYFSGCIIKLNNPLWLEAKWWNSFQWPQLNHKQKAFWCLCIFQSVSWLPECNNNCWTWNLSSGRWYTLVLPRKCMSVFMLQWSVLWSQWPFSFDAPVFCWNRRERFHLTSLLDVICFERKCEMKKIYICI